MIIYSPFKSSYGNSSNIITDLKKQGHSVTHIEPEHYDVLLFFNDSYDTINPKMYEVSPRNFTDVMDKEDEKNWISILARAKELNARIISFGACSQFICAISGGFVIRFEGACNVNNFTPMAKTEYFIHKEFDNSNHWLGIPFTCDHYSVVAAIFDSVYYRHFQNGMRLESGRITRTGVPVIVYYPKLNALAFSSSTIIGRDSTSTYIKEFLNNTIQYNFNNEEEFFKLGKEKQIELLDVEGSYMPKIRRMLGESSNPENVITSNPVTSVIENYISTGMFSVASTGSTSNIDFTTSANFSQPELNEFMQSISPPEDFFLEEPQQGNNEEI